jgi:hypothetical protein
MGGTAIFCIDARAHLTDEERKSVDKYKLGKECIYSSEMSKRAMATGDAALDGSVRGSLKSMVMTTVAALSMNITVNSLVAGQHVECKSLDELTAVEEAIMLGALNLHRYLETAKTFDGREDVFEYANGELAILIK